MTPLTTIAKQPWKRAGGWLVPGENCEWIEYLIVRRVMIDTGILEQPWASNRGGRIDEYTRRSGSSLGSYWCGIEAGAAFADCGAKVPEWYGAVDNWLPYMVDAPRPGSAVIYGVPGNGEHIEIVTRVAVGQPGVPRKHDNLSCGGNRGWGGAKTNNGIGVFHGLQTRPDVLGYVRPQPLPGWTIAAYAPPDFLLEHWQFLPEREREAAGNKIEDFLRAAQPAP